MPNEHPGAIGLWELWTAMGFLMMPCAPASYTIITSGDETKEFQGYK